jgi:hypothetical protein
MIEPQTGDEFSTHGDPSLTLTTHLGITCMRCADKPHVQEQMTRVLPLSRRSERHICMDLPNCAARRTAAQQCQPEKSAADLLTGATDFLLRAVGANVPAQSAGTAYAPET